MASGPEISTGGSDASTPTLREMREGFLVSLVADGISARNGVPGNHVLAREVVQQYAALIRDEWTASILRAASERAS